jgi:hypothetical protein
LRLIRSAINASALREFRIVAVLRCRVFVCRSFSEEGSDEQDGDARRDRSAIERSYIAERSRVCDVCVANMGEGFGKARTAYTLLYDVVKSKFAIADLNIFGIFFFNF